MVIPLITYLDSPLLRAISKKNDLRSFSPAQDPLAISDVPIVDPAQLSQSESTR